MRRRPAAALCLAVFIASIALAGTAFADKISDWKKLAELNDAFTPFRSEGSATHDAAFADAWKKWRDEFVPFAKTFTERYGADRTALRTAFAEEKLPEGVYVYPADLSDLLALDVDAHQKKIAAWLKKKGDEIFARWAAMKNAPREKLELKADYARRAAARYEKVRELDPAAVGDALSKAEKALAESEAEHKKAMKELKWPGHNPNFKGPGDPDDLAAAALDLLRKMRAEGRQWSKPEYDDVHIPLAACVVGDKWNVWKKVPLTQVPTQYSLKFFVAFKGAKDPDIAYGYYMFFYTEERTGVEMKPPFHYCNSQQYASFKMPIGNVKTGGGGAGRASSGVVAILFRLALSLLMIGGGVAAWDAFLRARLPQLTPLYDALAGKKEVLGLALLGVGFLALLRTVFSLAPLADILPQLSALALGLTMVSAQSLAQRVGNEKARNALTKLAPLETALAPHHVLLGRIALALGLIHLLIGGVILF